MQIYKAIAWMLGAMLSLFAVGLLGKVLGARYTTFEIMFYRSVLAFPLFCAFMAFMGKFENFHLSHWRLHILRNVNHFAAQNLWFYALATLPLAVVITFEFTTPAWVIIIAAFALGEGFGWRRTVVIELSLIGVLMITDPRNVEVGWPIAAALLCAVGFAVTMIFTKKLTKVQNVYEIIFTMTLMQAIFAGVIIAFQRELTLPNLATMPWILLIAFFGTSSHYCLTRALSLADASVLSPIDLLRLPLSVLAGWLLFGESVTLAMIFGTILLIAANYINIRRQA